MLVFGWISLICLGVIGLGIIGLITYPYVVSEIKSLKYRTEKLIEDKKLDADKKSEERKKRDEIKREKENELANKKLDAKLQKVDKQIEIYKKKLDLSEELRATTKTAKEELNQKQDKKAELIEDTKEDTEIKDTNNHKQSKEEEILQDELIKDELIKDEE